MRKVFDEYGGYQWYDEGTGNPARDFVAPAGYEDANYIATGANGQVAFGGSFVPSDMGGGAPIWQNTRLPPPVTAPATTNANDPFAQLGQDVLAKIRTNNGYLPNGDTWNNSPSFYSLRAGSKPGEADTIEYHPEGQGAGEDFYNYDTNGNFLSTTKGAKIMGQLKGALLVLGAAAGFGAVGGGAAAGGTAAGAGGTGAGFGTGAATGADLSAFYGGLDGASTLGGGYLGGAGGVGAGVTAAGAAGAAAGGGGGAAAGGAAAAGGTGSSIASVIQNIISGGGGMSWTDLIGPAMQAIGGAYQANQAGNATDAQIAAGDRGIAENRRQFDTVMQLLSPYMGAGTEALGSYRGLSGAAGPQAQQAALEALKGTPQFGMLVDQGEEAILQNASATGGLRGGNTQNSLADYRTRVLSGLVDQQLGRYGGLIQTGQNSAAGVGTAAMSTGQQVAALMQQQGAAQAGGIVAGSNAITNALGGIGGFYAGRGAPPAATGYGGAGVSGGGGFGTGAVYGNQDYGQYF